LPPALIATGVFAFLTVIPLVCAVLSFGASGACVRQNGQGSTFTAYTATVGAVQGLQAPMSISKPADRRSLQNCESAASLVGITPGWSQTLDGVRSRNEHYANAIEVSCVKVSQDATTPFQTDTSIAGLPNRPQRRLDSRPAIGKREHRYQQCKSVAVTTPPTA
jgi:hypothetical protein